MHRVRNYIEIRYICSDKMRASCDDSGIDVGVERNLRKNA